MWTIQAWAAEKAAQILRARLQPELSLLVRFNDKRGGSATLASLAAALRSAGQAMDPDKDSVAVFLTSHGAPDGLDVVAGRRSIASGDARLTYISIMASLLCHDCRREMVA